MRFARNVDEAAVRRARRLRSQMSGHELVLWDLIRGKKLGYKFRRQYAAGPYVLDFYCSESGLCIEVDGPHHAFRVESDRVRDDWLATHDIATLRIPIAEVTTDADKLVARIEAVCRARLGEQNKDC